VQPESLLQIRWGNLSSWFRIIKILSMDPDPTEKPFSDPDGYFTLLPYLFNEQLWH
jgi:hypothetical protein